MIITDRFVYLHLGKTGGTFVELVMERLHRVPKGLYYNTLRLDHRAIFGSDDQHECYTDLPPEYRDRPNPTEARGPRAGPGPNTTRPTSRASSGARIA